MDELIRVINEATPSEAEQWKAMVDQYQKLLIQYMKLTDELIQELVDVKWRSLTTHQRREYEKLMRKYTSLASPDDLS